MLAWLPTYLIALGIVAVECVIILALAVPFSCLWNQGDRRRLFGHLDTCPPKGICAHRAG